MAGSRRAQAGEIRIGVILSLIVLAVAIYFAYKVIPVKVNTYAFRKDVEEIAMSAAGQRARDIARVQDEVLRMAEERGLKEDILRTARERRIQPPVRVERTTAEIIIHVELVKPIDLIAFTWNWEEVIDQRRTMY